LTEKQKKLSEATTTSLSNLSSITVKIASSKEFSDRVCFCFLTIIFYHLKLKFFYWK